MRMPRSATNECGTYAGVSEHNRKGEPLCPDCRQAATDYAAYRRFRIGQLRTPRACRHCGSVFPNHHCGGTP